MTVALRALVEVFAVKVTVTHPLPLPLAGDTVAHDALELALHVHPVVVETVSDCAPPPLGPESVVGETE